jgi:hypothetical protein
MTWTVQWYELYTNMSSKIEWTAIVLFMLLHCSCYCIVHVIVLFMSLYYSCYCTVHVYCAVHVRVQYHEQYNIYEQYNRH